MEVNLGDLIRVIGALWPQRRDPLEDLQRQVTEVELRRRLLGLAPQSVPIDVDELWADRRDVVLVGKQGVGKTALAFWLASKNARKAYAVDWVSDMPDGFTAVDARSVARLHGGVFVWDEAALRTGGVGGAAKWLWSTAALARQRDQCHIWTTQNSAALDLQVLRQSVTILWMDGDSRFEREEFLEESVAARAILGIMESTRGKFAGLVDGAWRHGQGELPSGWSDKVSRAWR